MIRGDHDDRVPHEAPVQERSKEEIEGRVGPADRAVVGVRIRAAEDRGRLVVGVFVDVHQVEIEEPRCRAAPFDTQELPSRLDDLLIGSAERCRRVGRGFGPARLAHDRLLVHVEALREAEDRRDPAVPVERDRPEPLFGEDFGGEQCVVRDDVVVLGDTGARWVVGRPQGGHRGLRPGGLGEMAIEADAEAGEVRQDGCRVPLVAVGTHPFGA